VSPPDTPWIENERTLAIPKPKTRETRRELAAGSLHGILKMKKMFESTKIVGFGTLFVDLDKSLSTLFYRGCHFFVVDPNILSITCPSKLDTVGKSLKHTVVSDFPKKCKKYMGIGEFDGVTPK